MSTFFKWLGRQAGEVKQKFRPGQFIQHDISEAPYQMLGTEISRAKLAVIEEDIKAALDQAAIFEAARMTNHAVWPFLEVASENLPHHQIEQYRRRQSGLWRLYEHTENTVLNPYFRGSETDLSSFLLSEGNSNGKQVNEENNMKPYWEKFDGTKRLIIRQRCTRLKRWVLELSGYHREVLQRPIVIQTSGPAQTQPTATGAPQAFYKSEYGADWWQKKRRELEPKP